MARPRLTWNVAKIEMPSAINLRSLDALRGLLATYVVFHHARWLLWAGNSAWIQSPHPAWANALAYSSAVFRYGHEAVMVFFALSGFFIHLRVARKLAAGAEARVEVGRFYAHVQHRLLGPYIGALLITIVLDSIGRHFFPVLYSATQGDALLDSLFARKDFSVQAVVPAFCLLPAALGHDFGTNGPLWSLAYEVVYYLLYPYWCWLRQRGGILAYGVVPAFCLALPFVSAPGFLASVLSHYPIWLAGAGLAEWFCRGRVPKSKRDRSRYPVGRRVCAVSCGSHAGRGPFGEHDVGRLCGVAVRAFAVGLDRLGVASHP